MNTLYIHGLGSYPVPEKLHILQKYGLTPYAKHLQYEKQPDSYQILYDYAREISADFIIGSSLGGMLGYWIGEALGIPVLLFNPALKHPGLPLSEPASYNRKCPLRLVVIGEQDNVVDPANTVKFLEKHPDNGTVQKIVKCNWLAHQIPFEAFEEMVSWAVTNLKLAGRM